jgi:hypothetical protein
MFRIKWMTHLSEIGMIETDNAIGNDLDKLAYSCIQKLPKMRMNSSGISPDGFIILNDKGTEVRRWFGSPSPRQRMAQFHIQNNPRKIIFFSDETITWCQTIPQEGRRSRL